MSHCERRSIVNRGTLQSNFTGKSNWRTGFRDELEKVHGVRGYRKTAAMDSNTDRGDDNVRPHEARGKVGVLNHS